jgi:hypothetical protein
MLGKVQVGDSQRQQFSSAQPCGGSNDDERCERLNSPLTKLQHSEFFTEGGKPFTTFFDAFIDQLFTLHRLKRGSVKQAIGERKIQHSVREFQLPVNGSRRALLVGSRWLTAEMQLERFNITMLDRPNFSFAEIFCQRFQVGR